MHTLNCCTLTLSDSVNNNKYTAVNKCTKRELEKIAIVAPLDL